jgi:hypothetical protein
MRGSTRARRAILSLPRAIGQRRHPARYPLEGGFERVYLYHVRKTGGTSLAASFLALGGEDPIAVQERLRRGLLQATRTGEIVVAANHRATLQRGRYFFAWSHHPAWRLRLPARTLTVTILRDPAARAISLYRYVADPRADEGQPFLGVDPGEHRIAGDGFDRFLDRIGEAELLGQLQMFSPARDPEQAAARIRECSLVVRLEEMESGLATLSELIGRRLEPRHERRSVQPFEPTETQRARLREALAPEYELMDLLRSYESRPAPAASSSSS